MLPWLVSIRSFKSIFIDETIFPRFFDETINNKIEVCTACSTSKLDNAVKFRF